MIVDLFVEIFLVGFYFSKEEQGEEQGKELSGANSIHPLFPRVYIVHFTY
jgi:hypothetical protein